MKALVVTLLFFLIACSVAKRYSKCEVASILKKNGMGNYFGYSLDDWICLAFHTSKYNTQLVTQTNKYNSMNYGIFQINSRYWCKNNKSCSLDLCNKPCSAFLDDDITDDIACAKQIVKGCNRMNQWWSWKNCRRTNVSEWSKGCTL